MWVQPTSRPWAAVSRICGIRREIACYLKCSGACHGELYNSISAQPNPVAKGIELSVVKLQFLFGSLTSPKTSGVFQLLRILYSPTLYGYCR